MGPIYKLKSKDHIKRYHELKLIISENGLDRDDIRGLDQLLHLIQGMRPAKDAYLKYLREMGDWLNNIERSILEDINRQLYKKAAEEKAKEEGNKLDSAEG